MTNFVFHWHHSFNNCIRTMHIFIGTNLHLKFLTTQVKKPHTHNSFWLLKYWKMSEWLTSIKPFKKTRSVNAHINSVSSIKVQCLTKGSKLGASWQNYYFPFQLTFSKYIYGPVFYLCLMMLSIVDTEKTAGRELWNIMGHYSSSKIRRGAGEPHC